MNAKQLIIFAACILAILLMLAFCTGCTLTVTPDGTPRVGLDPVELIKVIEATK